MAESNKKKPRKSKIVLRECIEISDVEDDDNNAPSEMQKPTPEQDAAKMLLSLKNAISDESHLKDSPPRTPVELSVQVEVENYEDDRQIEDTPIEELEYLTQHTLTLPTCPIIISNDAVHDEVEKLTSSKSYSDKRLEVEIRNRWGKHQVPHEDDYHESLVQRALWEWRSWYQQSKLRTYILAYKCNICSIGWWDLEPFRQHIRIHAEVSLSLDSFHHECCIVAAQGQWFELMCLCKIEGNCPRCLRDYETHLKQKRDTLYYYCSECNDKFSNCAQLFRHEGLCVRFEKKIYQNVTPTESFWECEICQIMCFTQERYDKHFQLAHSVRSDLPLYIPTMKKCQFCDTRYHVYPLHPCSMKAENFKCKHCCRKFQNKALLDIHEKNTKNGYNCRICKRSLKKQCMEMEHLLKHSKNYVLVYKCNDCLDNVLFATERLMHRHRYQWHGPRKDRKRGYSMVIVPRSCMDAKWSEGVAIRDMVIDPVKASVSAKSDSIMEPTTSKPVDTITPTLTELQRKKRENLENLQKDEEELNIICTELKNKILKRAQSNASSRRSSGSQVEDIGVKIEQETIELDAAIDSLAQEEFITDIKEERIEDDEMDDDAFFDETESSINALLGIIKVKEKTNAKDQILDSVSIKEEPHEELANYKLLQDSMDSGVKIDIDMPEEVSEVIKTNEEVSAYIKTTEKISKDRKTDEQASEDPKTNKDVLERLAQDETTQNLEEDSQKSPNVESGTETVNQIVASKNQNDHVVLDKIVAKQQSNVKEYKYSATSTATEDIDIQTDFTIKQEVEDYEEYDDDVENAIKEEQEACMQELSKVFKATKDSGTLELSGISLSEEVIVKEELIDPEEFEDDIIMLSFDKDSGFNISVSTERMENSSDFRSDQTEVSKELNSDMDLSQFEPEVKLDQGERPSETDAKSPEPSSMEEIRGLRERKLYRCNKCKFVSTHREYAMHKKIECPRRKMKPESKYIYKPFNTYSDVKCTKCNTKFGDLRKYLLHFGKYHKNLKLESNQCPRCLKTFSEVAHTVNHLLWHVKSIFVKIQLLRESEYVSSRTTGLYQCKVCLEKVSKKNFFCHWEKHFTLEANNEEKNLVIDEYTEEEPMPSATEMQLRPDDIKKLLDQLTHSGESRKESKQCVFCGREFSRRNDVKRHAIEHLFQDARARRPALACQLCKTRFAKVDAYKEHMRNHAALPMYRCEICDKCFSDSSNFAKHKKIHDMHFMYICDLCQKRFHSRTGLEKHIEMHSKTEPVTCPKCGKVFQYPALFKKHDRVVHEKRRIGFKCKICPKRFDCLKKVWDHMWEAHKERSTEADCPLCEQSFRKFQDVRAHLRDHHKTQANILQRALKHGRPKYESIRRAAGAGALRLEPNRSEETLVVVHDVR